MDGRAQGSATILEKNEDVNTEEHSEGNTQVESNNEVKDDEKNMLSQDANLVVEKKGILQNTPSIPSEKNKANRISKQSYKGKYTVPQPFSLSSKKTSVPKGIMEGSTPTLSRSQSFKSESPTQLRRVQTSLRMERITELREGTTKSGSVQRLLHTQTSLKVERSIELRNGNSEFTSIEKAHKEKQLELLHQRKSKSREKQFELKKSSNVKDFEASKPTKNLPFKATPLPSFYQKRSTASKSDSTEHSESETEINKFKAVTVSNFSRKKSASVKPNSPEKFEEKNAKHVLGSSTFKATPLPSFYRRTSAPQKPELIKIPLTRPKSPNLRTASKSVADMGNSRPGSRNKTSSKLISDSAKETIRDLLKGPWKAPDQKSKSSKNRKPSCGDEVEKRVISSIENGEMVISS